MERFTRLRHWAACLLALAGLAASGAVRGSEIELTSGSFMADEPPADAAVAGPAADGYCPECDPCNSPRLFGLFLSTADTTDFGCFISPMTNPVYFEDPRTVTEARPIFIQHRIPNRAPLTGGDVQVIAVQLRAALTENLSIIATKDGYIISGSDAPAPTAGRT